LARPVKNFIEQISIKFESNWFN